MTTKQILENAAGVVMFNTIDEDACEMYDFLPKLDRGNYLHVHINTRTDYTLVGSPAFNSAADAVAWFDALDFVDTDCYAYLVYYDGVESKLYTLCEFDLSSKH